MRSIGRSNTGWTGHESVSGCARHFRRLMRAACCVGSAWLAVLALATSGDAQAGKATAPMTVPAGYALVWSDDFSAEGRPDAAKWSYDTGRNREGWHNHELQYYSRDRPQNAQLRGGRLVITARRETLSSAADWGRQRYTSARLITRGKAEWTYGFFEIRARLACGKGTWPAIWMLGSQGDWPAAGELDIMEHIGHQPGRVFSTVHTAGGSGASGAGAATPVPDACTNFHDYQMHWTTQGIRFGVDGVVHFEYANPGTGSARWPFDAPQFLILNIAIGGDLGGKVDNSIFPASMEIEHVRVHQRIP
jgi:beta-glucanase (GH16 family)